MIGDVSFCWTTAACVNVHSTATFSPLNVLINPPIKSQSGAFSRQLKTKSNLDVFDNWPCILVKKKIKLHTLIYYPSIHSSINQSPGQWRGIRWKWIIWWKKTPKTPLRVYLNAPLTRSHWAGESPLGRYVRVKEIHTEYVNPTREGPGIKPSTSLLIHLW